MIKPEDLDTLFLEARTHNHWLEEGVSEVQLEQLYSLLKFGPTSANCSPARFIFVKSSEAKERLKPFLAEGNVEKTMNAPVTVIIGHDYMFYEKLPQLFPHADAKNWFTGNQELIDRTAFRNGSLQAGYLIIAARCLGLDAGPMSGFDLEGVTKEFFGDTSIKADLLVNVGYGSKTDLHARGPRLSFDEAAEIL